jgi:hypothetical protein
MPYSHGNPPSRGSLEILLVLGVRQKVVMGQVSQLDALESVEAVAVRKSMPHRTAPYPFVEATRHPLQAQTPTPAQTRARH